MGVHSAYTPDSLERTRGNVHEHRLVFMNIAARAADPTERERTQMNWSALADCLWLLLLVSGFSGMTRLALSNQRTRRP